MTMTNKEDVLKTDIDRLVKQARLKPLEKEKEKTPFVYTLLGILIVVTTLIGLITAVMRLL